MGCNMPAPNAQPPLAPLRPPNMPELSARDRRTSKVALSLTTLVPSASSSVFWSVSSNVPPNECQEGVRFSPPPTVRVTCVREEGSWTSGC